MLIESWKQTLKDEFSKEYFVKIKEYLNTELKNNKVIYPARKNIFRALNLCPLEKIRAVILGQDPYHDDKQANGLCFSVLNGISFPPSLLNIFKEIKSDIGVTCKSGDLEKWAKQGVLLLNSSLTVRAHEAASHSNIGWHEFTDVIIQKISSLRSNIVFILWGRHAQSKVKFIDCSKHEILVSVHPSPLSANRGFFGCKHFSKANEYLIKNGSAPINWEV